VTAVDPAVIAELAYAEVLAAPPRTPARRAAVCVYVAATVPRARSVNAIKNAIGTFAADTVQRDAAELLEQLLYRLAAQLARCEHDQQQNAPEEELRTPNATQTGH
jgi:hypothetical protein